MHLIYLDIKSGFKGFELSIPLWRELNDGQFDTKFMKIRIYLDIIWSFEVKQVKNTVLSKLALKLKFSVYDMCEWIYKIHNKYNFQSKFNKIDDHFKENDSCSYWNWQKLKMTDFDLPVKNTHFLGSILPDLIPFREDASHLS